MTGALTGSRSVQSAAPSQLYHRDFLSLAPTSCASHAAARLSRPRSGAPPQRVSVYFAYEMSTLPERATAASPLRSARRTLEIEARAIRALADRLDASFARAVELILACTGRVVVSGMGKSGHVARKIASTLASTGTPAFFVHAAEASHGDLG